MTDQAERLPAPKGLFAHIQANNLKSLGLFVWFAALLQLLQISVMIFFVSVGASMDRTYRGDAVDVPAHAVLANKCGANTARTAEFCNRRVIHQSYPEFIYHAFSTRTQFFQGQSLYILIPASLYIIFGLWFHSTLTRRQTGAVRVSRQEEPRLHGLIEPLAIARGLPVPKIEVIESHGLNAYASGFSPGNASIGVSRGLINALNDAELESVLAHEFAHIENRDNRMMTIANLCAGAIQPIGNRIKSAVANQSVLLIFLVALSVIVIPWQSAVFVYSMLAVTWLLADLVKHTISRKREFIADARAIEIVKEPAALMSALQKIAGNDRIDGMHPAVQAMMISNLSGEDQSTHPSIKERIAAISATTNVTLTDAVLASQRASRDRWAGQRNFEDASHVPAGSAPAFGLRAKALARRGTAQPVSEPVGIRQAAFGAGPAQTTPQWTAEEIRSEKIIEKLEVVDKHATTAMKGILGIATLGPILLPLFLLPLVILYVVGSSLGWLMLPIVGLFAWKAWKRHERRQRTAAILEAT